MSVRTIEHRSKKRHSHSPGRKTKSPSYFPRHIVNTFEGEHLGMNVHPANKQWRRSWKGYGAYIPSARIEDVIIKYIGKPYADMCSELSRKLKECKTDVVKDINKELGYFFDVGEQWRWNNPTYGIDEQGNVFKLKKLKNEGLHLSPSQIKWNKSQKVPDWGAICKPRILKESSYWCEKGSYRYDIGTPAPNQNIGEFYQPKLIGEYWCIVHKNIVKLPVYHVPKGQHYLNWFHEETKVRWDSETRSYVKISPEPKYSDKFVAGQGKAEAMYFENTWTVPFIYFRKGVTAREKLRHTHPVKGDNPRYKELLSSIKSAEVDLRGEYAEGNKDYRERREADLARYKAELERTPETCMLEAGVGQLYPLVKEADYQKYMNHSQS